MADLPSELTFGKVVGRFILAVADSADAGRLPDAIPATGTITFAPKVTTRKTLLPTPATVIKMPIVCSLDSEGFLIDSRGGIGVWLVSGIYTVNYGFTQTKILAHDIEVLADHTDTAPLDLTNSIPPGGAVLTISQYAELSARIDAYTYNGTAPPLPDATTSVKGIVELATLAEVSTGTDTVRAVTPQGVRQEILSGGSTSGVRTDTAAQGLTTTQQSNARTNISVYSTTEIGNPETDLAALYVTAKL